MKTYNKLIRDRIPEIIEKAGKKPLVKTLSEEDFETALKDKLLEEVNEYLDSDQIEEIADVLEVLEAIVELRGENMEMIDRIKADKKEERGGFKKRLLLEGVEES